jgi:hypothetical protein
VSFRFILGLLVDLVIGASIVAIITQSGAAQRSTEE